MNSLITSSRLFVSLLLVCVFLAPAPNSFAANAEYQRWIEEMKDRSRGPFSRLRWFCKDGSILAPEPYACSDHGGGTQHGEWTKNVKALRDQGYYIATLLADEEPALSQSPANSEQLQHLLIERYLMAVDDGWIMRKSRYYRGSMQAEDEVRGARNVLLKMLQNDAWLDEGYLTLLTAVRSLPHGIDTPSVLKMRQMASDLSSANKKFMPLRNKIHISPDPSDAQAVREFAESLSRSQRKKYIQLADLIDEIYTRQPLNGPINRLAKRVRNLPDVSRSLRDMSARLISSRNVDVLFSTTANTLAVLRRHATEVDNAGIRLDMMDTVGLLEAEHFDLGRELLTSLDQTSRQQRLSWLRAGLTAAYGTGLLSQRQLDSLLSTLDHLGHDQTTLREYRETLNYLARVPGWAGQNLRQAFFDAMTKLADIEPKAELFIQDQLRGSALFFYVDVLDSLLEEANQLAGIQHTLFEQQIDSGLRSLNPGLVRGTLYINGLNPHAQSYDPKGIYLLPQTVADLPPVAGIITAGEGNPLSHIQLLARNLGIPNVSIDERYIDQLKRYDQTSIVLAVSPGGTVRIFADSPEADALFEQKAVEPQTTIRPDLEKLDLEDINFLRLSELRATDSGRRVGPKAAKLGELYYHFPEAVADGLTIPFAVFRNLLQQPMPGAGKSVFYWMKDQYTAMATMPEGSNERRNAENAFRQQLSDWIENANPGSSHTVRLKDAMRAVFGEDGSYGVFVRSDTNVEDLPNFTGAGLNLTVPNVIGEEKILSAISRVWASPFSERAFGWRQGHMEQPEHVYPSVLLMRSVPTEKSGVMVTQDIDTGEQGWLSIAVNEGVGGAVDGQAAESLKVNIETGEVILLAQATAKIRRLVDERNGGVKKVPVSGAERVLLSDEIEQLIALAKQIPEKFPDMRDEQGERLPADIEFGFLNGQLQLFQIRPFLDSAEARSSAYLIQMDQESLQNQSLRIDLNAIPMKVE